MPSLNERITLEKNKQRIRSLLSLLFEKEAFLHVEPSLFIETSTFIKRHPSFKQTEVIQTVLRDGISYAIRPDITTLLMGTWLPYIKEDEQLKVYYISNHYLQNQEGAKTLGECGFEVYGSFDLIEQLKMIETVLKTTGQEVTLVVGYPMILNQLLLDLTTQDKDALLSAIKRKSIKDLSLNVSESFLNKISPYLFVYDSLEALSGLVDKETFNVLSLVEKACPSMKVKYDLSMVPEFDYYSGISIKGFMKGYAKPILHGGSYDDRASNYGNPMQAFGISIDLDMLYQEVIL